MDDGRMTIIMHSYGLTWTDADGVPRASAVSYDRASAEHREGELEKAGATDIEILPIKPGELPEPRA
jgi:hypothetical protein